MLHELSVIKGELKRTLLRDCWAVWCSQKRGMRIATDGNFLFSCRRLRVAQLHRSVGCLSLRIRKKVKEDFASHTSDLSVEAQRAATRFDQSTLFNIVKRLKFKSSPSVPSVLLEDGKPASSRQEEQSRWLSHHAKQFGGSVLTEAQYAQSCKIERAAEQVMTAGNMSSVEILDHVAEVIAELPNRKAQGEDSVPNEILKAGGQPVCLQLAQLCSKANELAAVPLTWKGGLMVTTPKAGDLRDGSNHRAIQTASCVGKVYSKVLRRSLVPFVEKYARSDQHGGVKGRGTEIASLTARVLMRRFSKIGKSVAVLFVDARSAFYSLLLEQVLGAADEESALNKVLEKISDLFPDVLAKAAKHRAVERHELGTALQAAGLGDHFIRVLVNWHHRSWISVEGVRNTACCSKGTRPGDPLADIIFNLGMTFILSELDKCREEPPSVRWEPMGGPFFGSLGSSDTVSCPEVSYVDDLALFISHDSPGKLCDRVVGITNRLTEIMASFGLELNMKAGKTECILSLRGRGTAEAQRQLARDGKQIILPTKYAKLRIFQSYCHLGIILTKTGCITPEIAKRCKAMLGASLPIAHRVCASREICRSTKLQ